MKKAKGFGTTSETPSFDDLTDGIDLDVTNLHEIISSPSGRGEIDAWLGIDPASEDPAYKAAYDKTQVAKLLASPQDLEILEMMQPVMQHIVAKLSSKPEDFDILETVRSLMAGHEQA